MAKVCCLSIHSAKSPVTNWELRLGELKASLWTLLGIWTDPEIAELVVDFANCDHSQIFRRAKAISFQLLGTTQIQRGTFHCCWKVVLTPLLVELVILSGSALLPVSAATKAEAFPWGFTASLFFLHFQIHSTRKVCGRLLQHQVASMVEFLWLQNYQ